MFPMQAGLGESYLISRPALVGLCFLHRNTPELPEWLILQTLLLAVLDFLYKFSFLLDLGFCFNLVLHFIRHLI